MAMGIACSDVPKSNVIPLGYPDAHVELRYKNVFGEANNGKKNFSQCLMSINDIASHSLSMSFSWI